MLPSESVAIPSRVAMAGPRPLPRVMAYALLYLVDLTGCAAGWVAALRAGRCDPRTEIVYWTGIPARQGGGTELPAGSPIDRSVPCGTVEEPLLMFAEGEGHDLPLAEWMGERGWEVRMLLTCFQEEEANGTIAFLDHLGGPGFKPEVANLVRIYSRVAGQTFHALSETEHLIGSRRRASLGGLTERETEVATLAARGATNAEIAVALRLSTGTVKTHLHRVYEKLGIGSRTSLAFEFARIHGLETER